MKTKTSHTATPWVLNGNRITSWPANKHVAADPKEKKSNWPADSAYIARAVNAHADLVGVAQVILREFGDQMQGAFRMHLKDTIAKAISAAEKVTP